MCEPPTDTVCTHVRACHGPASRRLHRWQALLAAPAQPQAPHLGMMAPAGASPACSAQPPKATWGAQPRQSSLATPQSGAGSRHLWVVQTLMQTGEVGAAVAEWPACQKAGRHEELAGRWEAGKQV